MSYLPSNHSYHPDTGNLASNAGVNYTYGDSAHKHVVTSASDGDNLRVRSPDEPYKLECILK
jgi:hypothetical protein